LEVEEQEQERGGRGRAAGMRRRGKTTNLHPCKAARPKSYHMRFMFAYWISVFIFM
jgi:hypothetical protein